MEARTPPLHPQEEGLQTPSIAQGTSMAPEPKTVTARSTMWEKFNTLKKKREEVAQNSIEQRIKEIQQEALHNVKDALKTNSEKDILRECMTTNDRKRKSLDSNYSGASGLKSAVASKSQSESAASDWSSIKPFLDLNAHLKGVDRGRHGPKSQLEADIDVAVESGDLDRAELLSEQLSTRDFGKRIADAIDAKRYSEMKATQHEALKTKRKKRLHWGFDHKERWEMKGNM